MRLTAVILGLLAVVGAGLPAASDVAAQAEPAAAPVAAVPSAFAGIPNVEIAYYDVTGKTPAAIRDSMNLLRPTDLNDGAKVDALNRWSFSWSYPRDADGACMLAQAELEFQAEVRLPRLADPAVVPESVRQRWQRYMTALEAHEAAHVRHAFEGRASVLEALRNADCATATDAGRSAIAQLTRWDVEYDRRTRHGVSEGARFP